MLNRNLFANLPDLETDRLRLRRLRIDDASEIFLYASDRELPRYMTWDAHQTLDDTRAFLNATVDSYSNPTPREWVWGIVLKETGRIIGACSIFGQPEHARAEIGYWIGRPFWGAGLVTEAAGAIIKLAFDQMGLNRIEARCYPENVASARVMIKNGMVYEGTLREQMFVKGHFGDFQMYAILRREYLERREAR